ncbi:MAG: GSU2403 family nucleotidyltransferase fold protein [Candidatus Competibacteraceae bacterium]
MAGSCIRSIEHHFTVIGTHALYAYEAMAAVQCSMDLLALGDVDLLIRANRWR